MEASHIERRGKMNTWYPDYTVLTKMYNAKKDLVTKLQADKRGYKRKIKQLQAELAELEADQRRKEKAYEKRMERKK